MFRSVKLHEASSGTTGAVMTAAGVVGLSLLAYTFGIEPNWIEIRRVRVVLPGLPIQFHGYRIVQFGDIHVGWWMTNRQLSKIVRMVNQQHPDLIAITGDYVTSVSKEAAAALVPPLSKLKAKDGVLAVLGNHDHRGLGAEPVQWALHKSGIIALNNEVYALERNGASLYVAGVDSARKGKARLDLVLEALPDGSAAILLAHEPDFADISAATERFALQLSGHSHGGQLAIPYLGPPRLPPMGSKYHTGRYQVGNMVLYTTRGVGLAGIPIRFGCRPEITVLTLGSA